MTSEWPDSFDFETDDTCQKVFKPYIEEQLKLLEAYDSRRRHMSEYRFHIHARDAANYVKQTCIKLGLPRNAANNMYWATLIHDIGKMEIDPEMWDLPKEELNDQVRQHRRSHTRIGADKFLAKFSDITHPFKDLAAEIMANHHERLDGAGPNGLYADRISLPVRLVTIVEDFDGRRYPRTARQRAEGVDGSARAALRRMDEKMQGAFDNELYCAFKAMIEETGFDSSSHHTNELD